MEDIKMIEKEKDEYREYVEKLNGVDLVLEINKHPKTWTDERKILDAEKEKRDNLVKQPSDFLESFVKIYETTIEGYKSLRMEYRPPYIYYLMKYELRRREEKEEKQNAM